MDTTRWRPQAEGLVEPMLQDFAFSTDKGDTCTTTRPQAAEMRPRPHKEQALGCPRCNSTNTKFCYYNNYSLAQPRYYCRTCRRYWTEGGSLRNVPVGGGSRKNKRSSLSTAAAAAANSSSSASMTAELATVSTSKKLHADRVPPSISLSTTSEAPKFHEGHDRNLAFRQHGLPEHSDFPTLQSCSGRAAVGALSAIDLLLVPSARGIGPFMPMPLSDYSSGFGLKEFRPPTLSFPYGISGGSSGAYKSLRGVQESDGGKLLFPFEDLKPVIDSNNVADRGKPPGILPGSGMASAEEEAHGRTKSERENPSECTLTRECVCIPISIPDGRTHAGRIT